MLQKETYVLAIDKNVGRDVTIIYKWIQYEKDVFSNSDVSSLYVPSVILASPALVTLFPYKKDISAPGLTQTLYLAYWAR